MFCCHPLSPVVAPMFTIPMFTIIIFFVPDHRTFPVPYHSRCHSINMQRIVDGRYMDGRYKPPLDTNEHSANEHSVLISSHFRKFLHNSTLSNSLVQESYSNRTRNSCWLYRDYRDWGRGYLTCQPYILHWRNKMHNTRIWPRIWPHAHIWGNLSCELLLLHCYYTVITA